MPPKKPNKPNAFIMFAREIMGNSRKEITLNEAIARAGPIWENMNDEKRAPYQKKAKEYRSDSQAATVEKRNNLGTPITEVEKEKVDRAAKEWTMKRNIEITVRNSVNLEEFETQTYFFIMVNYFTRTTQSEVYVPAEISLCKFSLKDGLIKKFHTFVNPGVDMYGHLYEAQAHASATHQLPLPPKAMGSRDLERIYRDLINFVRNETDDNLPPVYTHQDALPIVESVLKFLTINVPQIDVELNVYSLQYLLFIMKEASCEIGEMPKIPTHHITDAYFDNDIWEFHAGLSCDFHEELDRSKYCTLSLVTRWAYMFCNYMCKDIAISLTPGCHIPRPVSVSYTVMPGSSPYTKRKPDEKDPYYPSEYKRLKSNK